MRRFPYFLSYLIKEHVILRGSYYKQSKAHVSSDWLEDHGRAWKHGSHLDYVLY